MDIVMTSRGGGLPGASPSVPPHDVHHQGPEHPDGRAWWQDNRPAWTEAGWWDCPMPPEIRRLMVLPKGAELLAAVQRVPMPGGGPCAFPHARRNGKGQPCICQIVVIAAWAAAAAWASDQADRAVLHALGTTEIQEPLDPDRPHLGTLSDPGVESVAPALRRSPASLRHHLVKVRERNLFPASLRQAIAEGFVSAWQADLIMQDLADVDPAGRDLVMDTVVDILHDRHAKGLVGWTFSAIRRRTNLIMAALGDELKRRRREIHRHRNVVVCHGAAGWSRVSADLPADVAERIEARLRVLASECQEPSDGRTLDEIRADVFVDLLLDHDTTAPAARAEVAVVIDIATLLGAADDPAVMSGAGAIPADIARTLAADSRWRAWITDATGMVVATSSRTYAPTAAVARVVRGREKHCRMPGCQRTVTDLDHVIPFPRGQTTASNLARLCRRHHNLKTHQGWRLADSSPRAFVWTDPNGIAHRDEHEPALPWD